MHSTSTKLGYIGHVVRITRIRKRITINHTGLKSTTSISTKRDKQGEGCGGGVNGPSYSGESEP
jgi:hypothetical protein